MSDKFKKGDLVRCIDSVLPNLELNKEYIVDDVEENYLYINDSDNIPQSWLHSRFELVESNKSGHNFKKGDVVKCIRGYGKLISGKTYIIVDVADRFIKTDIDDSNDRPGWYPDRFELVSSAVTHKDLIDIVYKDDDLESRWHMNVALYQISQATTLDEAKRIADNALKQPLGHEYFGN